MEWDRVGGEQGWISTSARNNCVDQIYTNNDKDTYVGNLLRSMY